MYQLKYGFEIKLNYAVFTTISKTGFQTNVNLPYLMFCSYVKNVFQSKCYNNIKVDIIL